MPSQDGPTEWVPRTRTPVPAITAQVGVVIVLGDVEKQVDDLVELDRNPDVHQVTLGTWSRASTTWRNHICVPPGGRRGATGGLLGRGIEGATDSGFRVHFEPGIFLATSIRDFCPAGTPGRLFQSVFPV